MINYAIEELNNAEDILVLIQDLKDPKTFFGANNEPKDITIDEKSSEVNEAILAARLRQYIKREARLSSNMNIIYGIIWVQWNPGLKSVLKVNK